MNGSPSSSGAEENTSNEKDVELQQEIKNEKDEKMRKNEVEGKYSNRRSRLRNNSSIAKQEFLSPKEESFNEVRYITSLFIIHSFLIQLFYVGKYWRAYSAYT